MEMKDVTRIFDVVYYQQANFPKKDALTAKKKELDEARVENDRLKSELADTLKKLGLCEHRIILLERCVHSNHQFYYLSRLHSITLSHAYTHTQTHTRHAQHQQIKTR